MQSSMKSVFDRNWSTLMGLFCILYIWASLASSAVMSISIATDPGVYGYFGVLVGMLVSASIFIYLLASTAHPAILLKCELIVPPLCSTLLVTSRLLLNWRDDWSSFWANTILGFSTFSMLVLVCRGMKSEIATKRERRIIPLVLLGIYAGFFALVFFAWPLLGDPVGDKIGSTILIAFSFSVIVNMASKMQKFDTVEAQRQEALHNDHPNENRPFIESMLESYEFSPREKEVLLLLARGYSAPHIADKLYVSNSTVKTHIARIYRKLGVSKRDELVELVESLHDTSGQ